jgi:hypothetical protein
MSTNTAEWERVVSGILISMVSRGKDHMQKNVHWLWWHPRGPFKRRTGWEWVCPITEPRAQTTESHLWGLLSKGAVVRTACHSEDRAGQCVKGFWEQMLCAHTALNPAVVNDSLGRWPEPFHISLSQVSAVLLGQNVWGPSNICGGFLSLRDGDVALGVSRTHGHHNQDLKVK